MQYSTTVAENPPSEMMANGNCIYKDLSSSIDHSKYFKV